MKLAGRWETRNSIRRFVRDEPEAPPAPGPLPLLRFNGKLVTGPKSPLVTKDPEKWYASDLRDAHLILHKRMLEKRARGIYDRPVLTNYAKAMIQVAEDDRSPDAVMLAASVMNDIRLIKLAESFR